MAVAGAEIAIIIMMPRLRMAVGLFPNESNSLSAATTEGWDCEQYSGGALEGNQLHPVFEKLSLDELLRRGK